jgi:prepilin-type N-terminal cleavage/methylation domain-containing protein
LDRTTRKNNSGFTLIEMTVVITILVLLVAAVMPNLTSEKRSREARQFFAHARNLVQETRSRSMGDDQTRVLRFDESGNRLVVDRLDLETGDSVEERALELPEGVEGSAYLIEEETSNAAEWQVAFYADGKSSKGGITLTNNGRPISIVIDEGGTVRQVDGELPDTSQDIWDAGGYEQRI